MSHSILPPSSAARRMACPGSRALEAQYYETEQSDAAREGDAAHWVLSEILKNNLHSANSGVNEYKDGIAPNGIKITQEMIEGIKLAYAHIKSCINSPDLKLHVEEPVTILTIHPDMWGTPDAWVYAPDTKTLYIFDYKFGYKFVEVFENWQLIAYAAGIIVKEQLLCNLIEKIVFTIIQPRCYGVDSIRTWTIGYWNVLEYFEQLRASTQLSMSPQAPCNPNPECKYCSARHACKALQFASLGIVEEVYNNTAHVNTPDELSNELRLLKRAQKLLDARVTGLEAQAIAELKSGNSVPHFTLEESRGRDYWTIPTEEAITLGKLFNVSLTKPVELITPKQAIDAGLPKEIISTVIDSPRGAVKLVEVDENKLKNIFNKQLTNAST